MAICWIRLRMDLHNHPKVVRMMSALDADRFAVVGGLHAAWGVFDLHTTDGVLKGCKLEHLDKMIGWDGFAAAMAAVEWLAETPAGLAMPSFDTHNDKAAKRRIDETERKRKARARAAEESENVRIGADNVRTDCGLDKRREDIEASEANASVSSDPDDAPAVGVDAPPSCPQQQIVALYAEVLPELPQVKVWDGERARALAMRWRWLLTAKRKSGQRYATTTAEGLDWFRRFFGYVRESDFLMGRRDNWTASLPWLVKSANFSKVIEGNYENPAAVKA